MNTLCIVLLVGLTGYVSAAVNDACGTGDPPAECDANQYCETNKCKVKAGMSCAADPADQCISEATCNSSSLCECGANHTPSSNMTMCLKNIEQECTADNECVHGATCKDDSGTTKCMCDTNTQVVKSDNSMCLLKIGQNCSAAGSMCVMETSCKEQTCMCPEKSEANTAMDKCLMYIEETCEMKADCVEGHTDKVVCGTDKKCACAAMYAPNEMMNMCKLKLNETCTADVECGMNAMCSTGTDKRCECKANYVNEENRCGMKVGGTCAIEADCVMNAECNSDKKCACKGAYTMDGELCKSGSAAVVASLLLMVAAFVTSRLM